MMANIIYNRARFLVANGDLDLSTSNLYIMLTYGYSPNIDTHTFVSDIVSYEIAGSGYARQALINKLVTKDSVNNRYVMTANNINWPLANFTASGGIIYNNTGLDSTSDLIVYMDFGGNKRSQNTPFIIEWSTAEGIISIR